MSQKWQHILQSDPIIISCDTDMETYYISGEEITQDEIIAALAYAFDNEAERADIADEISFVKEEMENARMREKDIRAACLALAGNPQYFDY